MKQKESSDSLSSEQIELVLNTIGIYAEMTNCASEAMGIQWWLSDQCDESYKYESCNLAEVQSLYRSFVDDVADDRNEIEQRIIEDAFQQMVYYLPEDLREDLSEYKNTPIVALPRIKYSAARYSENENLNDDPVCHENLQKTDEEIWGVARVFQDGMPPEPFHEEGILLVSQDSPGNDLKSNADSVYDDKQESAESEKSWRIALDRGDVEALAEALSNSGGVWGPEAVKLKRKLRLTALHEIAHVFLGEGQKYLGLPRLGSEEERILRKRLAPELLDRKSKRFSDYVAAEEAYLKDLANND